MSRNALGLALMSLVLAVPFASAAPLVSEAGVTLNSVSVEMPSSDRGFPAGAGSELVTNNCAACHSAGMILTQPKLTKAEWTGEVNKMIKVYRAPVDPADVPAIVSYLADMPISR